MIDDEILRFFKENKDGYISGEELSGTLNISRTAIWKHIEKLRQEGYDIIASPHLGYRLVSMPDRLNEPELKWELGTKVIGRKIYSYKEISSTNDAARSLAVKGEKEGAIVIAEYQTAGRGRLGRKWVSPRNKGAYFSVILRPGISPREIPIITLFSSLSVARAIRESLGLSAFIKWPNDVIINKKKVCGILTELDGEMDRVNFVIVGIGINVHTKKELLPDGATSLSIEKNKDIDRVEFVKEIFRNLDRDYEEFNKGGVEKIVAEYKKLSAVIDTEVQVSYNAQLLSGHVIDIDAEGALILRTDSGFHERVLAGDVSILR